MLEDEKKIASPFDILKDSLSYFESNTFMLRLFWLAHFVLCAFYNLIPNGFSNPLCLLWAVVYYVFICGFLRFYYHKQPYFMTKENVSSLVPSSKIFLICFFTLFFVLILPYIPLLFGFDNGYFAFFEKYMEAIKSPETTILNTVIFSVIFLVISPFAFCRPYLAWISALQGRNGSVRKAFKRTEGKYFWFLTLMFWLNLPAVIVCWIDLKIGCHGWLNVGFYSVFLLYFNVVFAKIYDRLYTLSD